jgi:ABC-type phosphate transport system permease subunit
MGLTAFSQPPVTVRIIAPPEDPTGGLGDVLLGSLGLTGVMVLIAVAAGVIFAGILFYIRSRSQE